MAEVMEREDVAFAKPQIICGHTIQQRADLEKLTGPQLVEIYNQFQEPDEQVKKFTDRATGVQRVWGVLLLQVQEDGIKTVPLDKFEASEDELAKQKIRQELQEARGEGEEEPEPEPGQKVRKPKAKQKENGETRGRPRGFSFKFPLGREGAKPPKETSKRFKVLQLLLRKNGASFEEVQEASGWKRTDAYEGIRLLHFANGYRLWQDDKGRIYASAEKA